MNINVAPKECLEYKTVLGLAPKFLNTCGCYKREEGLHVISMVEEESPQSSDNGRSLWSWWINMHTLLANLYTNDSWCLSPQLWLWYHLGINSATGINWHMSLIFSATARRNSSQNGRLWQTLDIANMFKPTFGFKDSQLFQSRNKIT